VTVNAPNNKVSPPINSNIKNSPDGTENVHDNMMEAANNCNIQSPVVVKKRKIAAHNTQRITVDENIFFHTDKNGEHTNKTRSAGQKAENRAVKQLKNVLTKVGTVIHQAAVLKNS
jgi:hypothetical protein